MNPAKPMKEKLILVLPPVWYDNPDLLKLAQEMYGKEVEIIRDKKVKTK